MCGRAVTLLIVGIGWWLAAGQAAAADVPIPDQARLMPKADLTTGLTPSTVQGVYADLTPREVRLFYGRRLGKDGWIIKPAPWFGDTREQVEEVRRRTARAGAGGLRLRQVAEAALAASANQIYAERDAERLLINITESETGSLFFINRWSEPAAPASGLAPLKDAGQQERASRVPVSGTSENICCSAESVPDAQRALPEWFPVYPAARRIAAGSIGRGSVTESYLTSDGGDDVLTYYRQQLVWSGWRQQEPGPVGSPDGMADLLSSRPVLQFESERGLAVIAVAEDPTVRLGEPTTIFVSYVPRAASGVGGLSR